MTTPVRAALLDGTPLRSRVADGLRAVASTHVRDYIHAEVRSEFDDSLDLDAALRSAHPGENRWDYLLGHGASGEVIGLEPHSASTGEISTVIAKLTSARRQPAAHMRPGAAVARWCWVASGRTAFVPHEKAMLRIQAAGILFVGGTLARKHLPVAAAAKPANRRRRAK